MLPRSRREEACGVCHRGPWQPGAPAALPPWLGPTVAEERHADRGQRGAALAAGRVVLERHDCRSCHRIEGRGGDAGPDLDGVGARLRGEWLAAYLVDPAAVTVRPWLSARMPLEAYAPGEVDALVGYFAAAAGVPVFAPPLGAAELRQLALGRAAFGLLSCGECHAALASSPAPDYRLARGRLRPAWVVETLLGERAAPPGMPALPTVRGTHGLLVADALLPMVPQDREALLAAGFASEGEIDRALADPRRVAEALAAYLLSPD